MRNPTLIFGGIAVTLLLTSASPQDTVNTKPKKIDESKKKVAELQTERIKTLKGAGEVSSKLLKSHRIEIRDVLDGRMTLLKAELEVAEKEKDRIVLYKNALNSIEEFEAAAKDLAERSRGTELNFLIVKAARLEIEILIEQAMIREAKESE